MSKTEYLTKDKLPDENIIELYWSRDEDAIKETDKKYGRYLLTISINILKNKLDGEECINDTYLLTWNKIPPTRPSAFQRFLSKITRDISIDRYRKAHASRRIPSELTVSLDELEECIEGMVTTDDNEAVTQIVTALNTYLKSISKQDRFIFVCRYYYADSVKYIAEMLNIGEKTVYRDLQKMRDGLKAELSKEGIVV